VSCLDGVTLAAYAAGDLAPAPRRAAEAHLVRCRDCRERVVALRRAAAEGSGEGGGAPDPEADAPPGGGFAMGFAVALGLVALALAAVERAMGGDGWLAPARLSGAYEMLFDLVDWARHRAPGLLELLAALVATASVAALAALGVASLTRRLGPRPAVVLALGLGAALAAPGRAFEVRSGDDVGLPAGERFVGSLAASGDRVSIDGTLEGDLFVAAERVAIRGEVTGNVFAWARELEVSGRIGGSLHAGCERARVEGEVGGGSYSVTESFALGPGGRIRGDAVGFARRTAIEGEVDGALHVAADELRVEGRIGRELHAPRVGRVWLGEGARVGGRLTVRVAREADLEIAPGAVVAGPRDVGPPGRHEVDAFWQPRPWLWTFLRLSAALLSGVALYAFLPGLFRARAPTASRLVRLLGTGLLCLLAAPLALVLLALTLVGLPLALLGGFAYLTALYLGHVLAAAELGRALLRRPSLELPGIASFARTLLVGLVAVALAARLPGVGPAVHVVVLLFGLGLLAERARALLSSQPRPRLA
jgi:cytoskeletal protein CcmA (bactofilin family)